MPRSSKKNATKKHEPAELSPIPQESLSEPNSRFELWWILLKTTLLTFVLVFVLFAISIFTAGFFLFQKVETFLSAADVSLPYLYNEIKVGWKTTPVSANGRKNILLLGLDSAIGRPSSPPLTDTIMILSINLHSGQVSSVTLPRDLWHDSLRTKINSLFFYGIKYETQNPTTYVQKHLEDLTGVPIHHTLVLTFDQVGQVIDTLGGVEIHVPHNFIDEQFPRADVDVTIEKDPKKLYEVVEFQVGLQRMDGSKALKYMRSRKSTDLSEGTDVARGRRQQAIIQAVVAKIQDPMILTNPTVMGSLFAIYREHYEHSVPFSEVVATAKQLYPHHGNLKLVGHQLSIFPGDANGVIWHPRDAAPFDNQWVYTIRDTTRFQQEVQTKLYETP